MSVETAPIPYYPAERVCPHRAPADDVEFREAGGLHHVTIWDGSRHWLATRYADVRAVLTSRDLSADVRVPGFPVQYPGQVEQQGGTFLRTDGREHARWRQLLIPHFTSGHTESLRPRVVAIVDELIDAMSTRNGLADLAADFGRLLAARTTCLLMGVPPEDIGIIWRFVEPTKDVGTDQDAQHRAACEALEYLEELIERKRRAPGADLISRLAAEPTIEPGGLARVLLIVAAAGFETTASMVSLGALTLLTNPLQRDHLRDRPSEAVLELLRYWSVIMGSPRRVAATDTRIGDRLVRKGEGVVVSVIAANHDPRKFGADAEKVDIGRDAAGHATFGFGAHRCIGEHVARLQLEVAWLRLFDRLPGLRLAVSEDALRFRTDNTLTLGIDRLPVTWSGQA